VLAGAWALVVLPLMDTLKAFDLASRVPVPAVFEHGGTVRTLDIGRTARDRLAYLSR